MIPPVIRQAAGTLAKNTVGRLAAMGGTRRPHHGMPISLHIVLSRPHVLMSMLAMGSLELVTGKSWAPVFHDDGTLRDADAEALQRRFPDARVIRRAEADKALSEALTDYPVCRENRMKHPWFLKYFDTRHYAPGERYIVMDSDIVFFKTPAFVLDWMQKDSRDFWFMQDVGEKYIWPRHSLEEALGFALWPGVNSGLDLMYKPGVDLALAERFLTRCDPAPGHYQFLEQTLFAVTGSAWGHGGTLPGEYEVSWDRFRRPKSVMRHYVGPFKNDLLYIEGASLLLYSSVLSRSAVTS